MAKCRLRQRRSTTPALVLPTLIVIVFTGTSPAPATDLSLADEPGYLEPVVPTRIDHAQKAVSTSVNDAARWLDSFFLDERFLAEEAYTRVRLSPGIFFEEGEAPRFKFSANAKVRVPSFNEKLKLTISGDTDETLDDDVGTQTLAGASQDSDDQANIGLEYFFREKRRLNTSLSTGIKLGKEHGVDLYIGPRVRKTFEFDLWQLRFTERLRWYTDIGWESVTSFDLERALPDKLFFRGTVAGRWREEDPGYRYEIRPTLFKHLRRRAAIEYQWNNLFVTDPNHTLDEVTLRVRYRQQKWRKWLFFEISPQLAFANNDDFRATPGIELRLEATFGGLDTVDKKRRREPAGQSSDTP